MVRQYVGARYVPKFADPVAWASGTSYEAMTIVTYNNSSYTSKIPVPATVGNPADNPDYWALTGNYNAQVEQYRQETETVSNNLTTLQGQITTVSNNLTTEITNRKNADTTLQDQITTVSNNLTTEITIRKNADTTLQNNIDAEAATRASADSNLQSQINQIVAPSGEAPSAAEVQNARIGADGVTYSTLGEAIRTQVGELNNAFNYQERGTCYNIDASASLHSGYLTSTNTFVGTNNSKFLSKTTPLIPCNENDIFYYMGNGEYNAQSVLFFNNDFTVIEALQYNTGAKRQKITAPVGATFVRFSSYTTDGNPSDIRLSVIAPFGMKYVLENNVYKRINDLETKTKKVASTTYIKQSLSLISDKYVAYYYNNYQSSNEAPLSGAKCTDFIEVTPSEELLVSGNGSDNGPVYVIYDIYKNPIAYYPTESSSSIVEANQLMVTIPENGRYIRLSAVYSSMKQCELYRKSTVLPTNDIANLQRSTLGNCFDCVSLGTITNNYLGRYGDIKAFSDAALSDYIPVYPQETLLITGKCANGARLIGMYDDSNNLIGLYPAHIEASPTITANDLEFIVPTGVSKIRVSAVSSKRIDCKRRVPTASIGNTLYGKKYVAIGDSFTHGDFRGLSDIYAQEIYDAATSQYKTYPWQIANRNSMALTNLAVNGSKLVDFVNNERWTEIPVDTDYCTIMYGLNDFSEHIPIGTIDDTTSDTFYGAWNILLDWINNNRKDMHVGIIICSAYLGDAYRTATENVAKKYGIPFLNQYTDPKVPMFFGKKDVPSTISNVKYEYYKVTASNGHPNIKAHILESNSIEMFMRSL